MTSTRYSPVAPIRVLEDLAYEEVQQDKRYLGDYLLLLAHEVLDNKAAYRTLVGDVRHRHSTGAFIMMDNSVVELGKPMSVEEVIAAADVVLADVIMTPDVLGSFSRTQRVVEREAEQLLNSHYQLMRIPQGASNAELIECVDWLRTYIPTMPTHEGEEGVEYWGIPRWITNQLGSRGPLIQYICMTAETEPRIHLLGMSKNIQDDLYCVRQPGVMGIDSANPLVNGYLGHTMRKDQSRHWERGDFWECTGANEIMINNVGLMHEWVSAEDG